MSDRAFFDTNILVHSLRSGEERGEISRRLFLAHEGVISVQVVNEFTAVARRKLQQDWRDIQTAVEQFLVLFPHPATITVDTYHTAAKYARRYQLNIYDGLVLASAAQADCSILFSEDMQHGQRIGQVTIQNPYLGAR